MKKDYISPDILTHLVNAAGSLFEGSFEVEYDDYDHNSEDYIDDPNDII